MMSLTAFTATDDVLKGSPRAEAKLPGRERWVLPAFVASAGFLLSLTAFLLLLGLSFERTRHDFLIDAEEWNAWIAGSLEKQGREFAYLTRLIETADPSCQALAKDLRSSLNAEPAIVAIDVRSLSGNQRLSVPCRMESSTLADPGFEERADAFLASFPAGFLTIGSAPRTLLFDDRGETYAVYLQRAHHDGGPDRLVAGFIALEPFFSRMLAPVPTDLEAVVFTVPSPDGPAGRPLYRQDTAEAANAGQEISTPDALIRRSAFHYRGPLQIGDLRLELCFFPAPALLAKTADATAWTALVCGLLLTAAVGLMGAQIQQRHFAVARLVRLRTTALHAASGELERRSRQLERAKVVAEAANASKSEFLANMSHEIRTPLNSMLGMAELVLDSPLNPQQKGHLQTILGSAENLLEIINDILDFSKIESGKLQLEPVVFCLRTLLEELSDQFGGIVRKKSARLELVLDVSSELPPYVKGDPVRIKQIVTNLLGNAIKFTSSGHVRLHLRVLPPNGPDELAVKIEIEDTGIGIPKDKQEHIFEKFAQADSTTTRLFGGTGLGLAICRKLSMMMGGTVGVESLPGSGSTFWFTMMLEKADRHAGPEWAKAKADERAVIEALQGHSALIVDDNAASRAMLVSLLTAQGMICSLLDARSDVLERAAAADRAGKPFTFVLFDHDGDPRDHETMKRVAGHGALVVALLAHDDAELLKALPAGSVAAALAKPVHGSALLALMSERIAAKRRGDTLSLMTRHHLRPEECLAQPRRHITGAEILLVDDNRVNLAFAGEALGRMGCHVTTASNGQEALDLAGRKPFDLIFMDCQMPVMDGFEASRRIRDLKKAGLIADTPVIALTANAMKGDKEECLAAGMQDYLSKPVRKADFERALHCWLAAAPQASGPPVHSAGHHG